MPRPKPLQGPSPTGFYRADGSIILEKDKNYYEKRGVSFEPGSRDLMPDGVRLKPKRLRSDAKLDVQLGRRGGQLTVRPSMTEEEFHALMEEWKKEYDAIDGEKPPFNEWQSDKGKELAKKTLLFNALVSARASQSSRAAASYLEFTESKPKSQVEVSQPEQPTAEMSPMDMIAMGFEALGIEPTQAAVAIGIAKNKATKTVQ